MSNCAICQKALTLLNKPTGRLGVLETGEEICFACFQKIHKVNKEIAKNLKGHSKDQVISLLAGSENSHLIIGPNSNEKFEYSGKKMTTGKKIFIGIGFILFILIIVSVCSNPKKEASNKDNQSSQPTKTDVKVGELLKTQYFDIVVNKASLNSKVSTGNEFADLKPEQGIKYLIINATFKNTDNESRMLLDGSVWINYNGKEYEFDKSETIFAEGWGLLLDQINPLITKTTNLVYKIPAEINGNIYWQPGRANNSQRIFLGSIK